MYNIINIIILPLCMIMIIMGCSRKNPHPPDGWDSGNSRGRGGSKTPEIQAGGEVDLKKVFCRGHFDR